MYFMDEVLPNMNVEFAITAFLTVLAAGCTVIESLSAAEITKAQGMLLIFVLQVYVHMGGIQANPSISMTCGIIGYFSKLTGILNVVAQFAGASMGYHMMSLVLETFKINEQELLVEDVCVTTLSHLVAAFNIFYLEFSINFVIVYGWITIWYPTKNNFNFCSLLRFMCWCLMLAVVLFEYNAKHINLGWYMAFGPQLFGMDSMQLTVYFLTQMLTAFSVVAIRS